MGKGDAVALHNLHGKAGTVATVLQARSAPDVGIAEELQRIVDQLLTARQGSLFRLFLRAEMNRLVQCIADFDVLALHEDIIALLEFQFDPAVQLLHNGIALTVVDLSPDCAVLLRLGARIQNIGVHNGHQRGVLHGLLLGLFPGRNILRLHITCDTARLDFQPAVRSLQDIATRLGSQFAYDLTVLFRLLAYVQIARDFGDAEIIVHIEHHGAKILFSRLVQTILNLHVILADIAGARLHKAVLLTEHLVALILQGSSHAVRVLTRRGANVQLIRFNDCAALYILQRERLGLVSGLHIVTVHIALKTARRDVIPTVFGLIEYLAGGAAEELPVHIALL